MAGGVGVSLLFLVVIGVLYSHGYIIVDDDDPTSSLEWPTEYYFKGETFDLITGLVHPFEWWYSTEYNRSRMDLYDGEIKKYYIGPADDDDYGSIYSIHSITSKDLENIIVCEIGDGGESAEDFLPDVSKMEFVRNDKYNGKDVQVWKRENTDEDQRVVETVTVHRNEQNVDIPYESTQKMYNVKKGDETTSLITKFYEYKSTVDRGDLEATDEDECEDISKIGKNLKNYLTDLHPLVSGDVDRAFKRFKTHHNKKYREDEHEYRKRIFHQNWKFIEDHNRKNLGFKLEVNKFADRTEEELGFLTGTLPSKPESVGTLPFHTAEEIESMMDEIPEEFDLRIEGAMRPVKNQGNCGSCWAFCTTAAVEGALARDLGGKTVDLSEQSLVDCAWGYDNMGCNGGMLDTALKYILDHGIPEESDYGLYKAEDGTCHIQNLTTTHKIRGFGLVDPVSANSLKVALYKYGPVAVSIYAGMSMKYYSHGVYFDPNCPNRINHGVTVVGYGTQDRVPYWIVRNSWGEDWGEDGYILMSALEDNCLILDSPYYVVI